MADVPSPDDSSLPIDASHASAKAALSIIARLREHGHVAYLAGGCVRDRLLGRTPKDHDVATDALPQKVMMLYPRRSRAVGQAFGVVLVKSDDCWIEVATFRKEWGYGDGRRPDQVEFCDAQQDALRRDFTINGLFFDPSPQELEAGRLAAGSAGQGDVGGKGGREEGGVLDYVGGQADLQARVIRAIGQPEQRFGEDYLRLLRAVRFAARFDFRLEPRTESAIRSHARYLGRISRERIGQEIQLMLTGARPLPAAQWIEQLHLDAATFNEDHLESGLATLARLDDRADATLRLTAWLLDRHQSRWAGSSCQPSDIAQTLEFWASGEGAKTLTRWRKALCLTNDQHQMMRRLLALLPRLMRWSQTPLAMRKRLLADDACSAALALLTAMNHCPSVGPMVRQIQEESAPLLQSGVSPTPWLTGDDLVAMGFEPGPPMGRLLNELYDRQLDGRLPDRDAALLWLQANRS